jgi:hypothetical protein
MLTSPPTSVPFPSSPDILPAALAQGRLSLFCNSNKKTVLDGCMPSGKAITSIPLCVNKFLHLLTYFSAIPGMYNGVRVHFGCYPNPQGPAPAPQGQDGQIALLFVPTTGPGNDPANSQDDNTKLYYFYDTTLMLLDAATVKAWKFNYKNLVAKTLTADGINVADKGFYETCSLWYEMDSIISRPGATGLIELIQDGLSYTANPIIGLNAQLCCFIKDELSTKFPFYQLTLTFNFPQLHDAAGFAVGSVISLTNLIPTDTGIPCPPAGNCPPTS